uniref:MFS domain-containing protein n=1 Tax=Macrostomum lignano TaxID=282301 RepID=A0A1I8JEB9_9PLAT
MAGKGQLSPSAIMLSTHANIALYSLAFWIQQAAVPFLLQKWEASNLAFGYLQTMFAAVQLLGGPLFGRFGDLYGARLALCLAFGASGISCLTVALTDGLFWMFLSRLPLMLVHAMQGGQMVVTDLSDPLKRSDSLAKLGISYGVGMVLGSLSSGFIIKATSEHYACFIAAVLSFGSMSAVWLTIPANLKASPVMSKSSTASSSADDANEAGFKSSSSGAKVFDLAKFSEFLVKNRRTRWLLAVKVVTGIPIGLLQSMMPIISVKQLGATPQISGIMMAYVAVVSMAVQGLGISVLTKRFSDSLLLTVGCAILTAFLGTQIYYLFVCILPLVIGLTLINVLVSSALTNAVSLEDTGSVLGINMSINSVIRIASPTLGGLMLDNLGVWSFGFLGSVNSALVAAYILRAHLKRV